MADNIVFTFNNKTITLAEYSGFCYGVQAALDKTYNTIDEFSDGQKNIFTFGPIIHNEDVVAKLSQKNVCSCTDFDKFDNSSIIIIRSHGIDKTSQERLQASADAVIDATCPHVKKIHKLVASAYEQGKNILIIGDKDHPEVQGINGWCEYSAYIAGDESEIPEIFNTINKSEPDKILCVVAQTTFNTNIWSQCLAQINKYFPEAEINRTICSATENRQNACKNLAEKSDLMVIIGSKSSSNTKKLYDIAKKVCRKTYLIENHQFLPLKEIAKCNRIGISAGASTPERIIKEVIAHMSEVITNNANEENAMHDFMEEIEKSLKMPQRGDIVKGEVIQVGSREVYVNLGCKKDGIIPKDEIALEGDQTIESLFKLGDVIDAKVLKNDDGEGNILLSRKKIELGAHWEEIIKAFEEKAVIDVKVTREVKGGVIAVFKEVSGFIPMSQLNDRYIEKADEFIGKVLPVKVSRVDQRRNKAVFSHKAYLAEEKNKKVAEIWASLHVGDTVEGTVMRFTDYGAFVDIGGIDGLLHISEISWGKLKHPQEALEIGQKINVKILSMNEEKGKISLGLKQNTPEPWSIIDQKYSVGQIIEGKVVQIKEYGAFVEIEPGLDGLVHISEIASKRVTNIADEISIGQTVSAKILEIDHDKKRISLSIKATTDDGETSEDSDTAAPESTDAAPAEAQESSDAAPAEAQESSDTPADTQESAETVAE